MKGIEQGLDLPREAEDDVWSLTERERTSLGIEPLPKSLNEAIEIAENSELLAETLGEHVFDFFLRNKRAEWDEYRGQVSAFERDRMLPVLAGPCTSLIQRTATRARSAGCLAVRRSIRTTTARLALARPRVRLDRRRAGRLRARRPSTRTPATRLPDDLDGYDGLLVLGGAMGANDDEAPTGGGPVKDLIRVAAAPRACPPSASASATSWSAPPSAGCRSPTRAASRSGCSTSAGPRRRARTRSSRGLATPRRGVQWNYDVVDRPPAEARGPGADRRRRGAGRPLRPGGAGACSCTPRSTRRSSAPGSPTPSGPSSPTAASTPTRCSPTSRRPGPSWTRPGAAGRGLRRGAGPGQRSGAHEPDPTHRPRAA